MSENLEVLILAAGKGTRMKSELPKVLHRVCGLSLIERSLRSVVPLQPERISLVVGYGADKVRLEVERIKQYPRLAKQTLTLVTQQEQKGTGHAVQVAENLLSFGNRLVLILPGDVPLLSAETLQTFLKLSNDAQADVSFLSCRHPQPAGFGRVVRDESGKVLKIVEDKDCSPEQKSIQEINSSIYAVRGEFLKQALASLKANNAQGELYLTDIIQFGVEQGRRVEGFVHPDPMELSGANNRAELATLEALRRALINRYWMMEGVTLEDPRVTYINEDVRLETDVIIGAGCQLLGSTRVGKGTHIESNSIVRDSLIGEQVHIRAQSIIEQSLVKNQCVVGPFARLRPGSELAENAHVGNFVETKNCKLGAGSKANHLTYLGDAEIGEGCNIGAGVITCNYDGVKKHKTVVGARSFVGSNANLVAPILLGEESFVGAGSTINKDVPAGALALTRSEMKVVEGWSAKRKNKKKG